MAHIVSFEIANLAGRETPYVETLHRHVNIFFGLNGTGKTSLLKILHSALTGNAAILENVPFTSAQVTIQDRQNLFRRTFNKPESSRNPRRFRTASTSSFAADYAVTLAHREQDWVWSTTPANVMKTSGWGHTYLSITRLFEGDATEESSSGWLSLAPRESIEGLDVRFGNLVERLWTRYTASLLRRIRNAQEIGMAALLGSILTSPSQQALPLSASEQADMEMAYKRVQHFLKRQPVSHRSGAQLESFEAFRTRYITEQHFRAVVEHLNNIEARIEEIVRPRTRLAELLNRLFANKSVKLEDESVSVSSAKDRIPLALLSSGEKHVLRLFIEALTAGSNPILIDEPELSLHVDWQRSLVPSLVEVSPDSQLVLATHSPEVMAVVSDEHIHSL